MVLLTGHFQKSIHEEGILFWYVQVSGGAVAIVSIDVGI